MANITQAQSTQTAYRVTLTNPQGHIWYADEPSDKGGQDTAPNPIQILLSALGACTVVTLEMYANHKGLKIEHVQLDLALNPEGDPEAGQNNISRKTILKGDFTEEQHKRLLKVAESCPVHKLLTSNIQIQTELGIE
ncbi:OsmC family protein [Acinetobacter guillouiae]|uniref:OsmC family protein n=1 Tax=Acinetobacter guillouiae TaxID=106649 RepID=UPI0012504DC9|nr:OsmC family protein [Acinetobacter guillouiae]